MVPFTTEKHSTIDELRHDGETYSLLSLDCISDALMNALYSLWKKDRLSLEFLLKFVYQCNFPLQTLHLPSAQGERENWDKPQN